MILRIGFFRRWLSYSVDVYFGGCVLMDDVGRDWLGVVCMGVFYGVYFGCCTYIRRF